MNEIKVHLVQRKNRPFFFMRYIDPVTGKQEAKSTGTRVRRDADRIAAKWEADLREGRYSKTSQIRWDDFRDRYNQQKLATLAGATAVSANAAMNYVERIISPRRLADLTPETLSRFQARLRQEVYRGKPLREATIAGHLRYLRAATSRRSANGRALWSTRPKGSSRRRTTCGDRSARVGRSE